MGEGIKRIERELGQVEREILRQHDQIAGAEAVLSDLEDELNAMYAERSRLNALLSKLRGHA